jgi:hypothetical protein
MCHRQGSDTLVTFDFAFTNGECLNPRLSVVLKEIDFASEYNDVFVSGSERYTTGTNDSHCEHFLDCLSLLPLTPPLNDTWVDAVRVSLLKAAQIKKLCTFATNANVTVACGPPIPTAMPTSKPSHPGELTCGHSKSGAYNDVMVEFECRTSFEAIDGAMSVDFSGSDFDVAHLAVVNFSDGRPQRRTMQCSTARGRRA